MIEGLPELKEDHSASDRFIVVRQLQETLKIC